MHEELPGWNGHFILQFFSRHETSDNLNLVNANTCIRIPILHICILFIIVCVLHPLRPQKLTHNEHSRRVWFIIGTVHTHSHAETHTYAPNEWVARVRILFLFCWYCTIHLAATAHRWRDYTTADTTICSATFGTARSLGTSRVWSV